MIDSKIMETTKSILKDFGNTYFSDKGTLNRNKVIEDLDAYTPMLMKALLANQLIHDTYTESIVIDDKSVELFKLNQFIEMFTYKEYWQDSYTKFENKIGLTAGGKFIDETADVVLDFPFKDTVLKAGMTKEDQKDTDEPFLHETIAKAEIDQLLEPKIFVNATKYDQKNLDGASTDSLDDNNLIIKGNNLIALHSLHNIYAGKVQLIYLDPPYNTGKDGFAYNDKYNRSSWLTFMFNRLEIAKKLLSEDGSIFINIDYHEVHYLKVLMDSIFGEQYFKNNIVWNYTGPSGSNKFLPRKHDDILYYGKSENTKYHIQFIKHKSGIHNSGQVFGNKDSSESYKSETEAKGKKLEDWWDDIYSTDRYRKELLNFSGQKPEKLIQRIINIATDENDIVLDFFMGTATTQAVAMKMNRRFIGIEQMDYIKTVSVERLKKVIAGEQGGISKDVNWQGGGSFVYAELMEKNQGYLKDVQQAETTKELEDVVQRMIEGGADFDFRVDVEKVLQDPEYQAMVLPDKKQLIVKVIDKNQLYYAYSDMDDRDVQELMSDSDIAFNKSFYGERDL
ncbi:DNA methyltransferase [Leuconostoc citreum]|uniref:DNA methyltransferase n=1 Tax=Leuconostoc citreum TaxID=33964 RepID=UPI0019108F7B|nr:DNA methyltransferase [Leuconostoc citreum]QQE99056.1 site-specific DNA-methyltransferase [Leuconostoc citreum]